MRVGLWENIMTKFFSEIGSFMKFLTIKIRCIRIKNIIMKLFLKKETEIGKICIIRKFYKAQDIFKFL